MQKQTKVLQAAAMAAVLGLAIGGLLPWWAFWLWVAFNALVLIFFIVMRRVLKNTQPVISDEPPESCWNCGACLKKALTRWWDSPEVSEAGLTSGQLNCPKCGKPVAQYHNGLYNHY